VLPQVSPQPLVLPVKADRKKRLALLRREAPHLGQALRNGNPKNAYQILRWMCEYVSLRACECPRFKPDFEAVRKCYPKLVDAIKRDDLLGSRDALSEMIDRAGLTY